jgi:hypothetical protein
MVGSYGLGKGGEMTGLSAWDDVRELVRGTLCRKGDLEESTPIHETLIRRGQNPCGVEFLMNVGRAIRLSAIWVIDEGRVLFYDANQQRFAQEQVGSQE